MKRAVALALAAALTGAAPAAASTIFGTRGSITAIAADGMRVAIATTALKRSCDRIVVWDAAAKTFARFDAHTNCPGGETSGGQRVAEVALAGARVGWVESSSGNFQDLTLRTALLWEKKIAGVAFAENHYGADASLDGDWIGKLYGDGSLLAFNTWHLCETQRPEGEPPCEPGVESGYTIVTEQRLWKLAGGVKAPVRAGPDALSIVAVDGGRIAAQRESGPVTVFGAAGAVLGTIAVPPGSFAGTVLQGSRLVALRNGALEVYDLGSGALAKTIELAPGKPAPELRDVQGALAVYVRGLKVHVVRVTDGREATIAAAGEGPVDAQLEPAGLFYSYQLPRSTAHGRVAFVPLAELERKLG